MSNRDNFTQNTKDIIAQRVAYRCSYKDCGVATIGPQYGDMSKSNNMGIACHICAASPGGPRYDATMTREERVSAENGIWMCPTHAELIDHDFTRYPVELLHEWKKEAEEKARANLVNYNFSKSQLINVDELKVLFDRLIKEGNYDALIMLIDKAKYSDKNNELLLRYEIIYNIYCNRDALAFSIDNYINNVSDKKCDVIAEELVANCISTELDKLIEFCSNQEIIYFAKMLIDGTIHDYLFRDEVENDNSKEELTLKDNNGVLSKLISNLIINNKYLALPTMGDGNKFELYDKEFAYKMMAQAWKLFNYIMQSNMVDGDKKPNEAYFLIKTSLNKIEQLDKSFQKFILGSALDYVINDKAEFNMLYKSCPLLIKESQEFKRLKVIFGLIHNEIDADQILYNSEIKEDEKTLISVLQAIPKEKRFDFLEDNRYLLKRNSIFLYLWIMDSDKDNEDKEKVVLSYKEYYKDDFLWNCLAAYYFSEKNIPESLIWLERNRQNLDSPTLILYIKVLGKYSQWKELRGLAEAVVPPYLKYKIGLELMSSNSNEDNTFCLKLFKKLEDATFYEKGFYHNYGVLYFRANDIFKASIYFEKEYDISKDEKDLLNILYSRIDCSKFELDEYIERASKSHNSELLCLVAFFYEKNQNYYLYKIYLIKSFIANPENENAKRGLAFLSFNEKLGEDNELGKIYSLENKNKTIKIALLDNILLNGIESTKVMDFVLVDANASEFNSWRFYEIGEMIEYNAEKYVIKAIDSFTKELSGYVVSQLMTAKDVIAIKGKTPEEAIKNLSEILFLREDRVKQVFSKFNESKGMLPVTFLAKQLGSTFSEAWYSLICENDLKINNFSNEILGEHTLVLCNDSIITLYSLGAFSDLNSEKFIIPNQVKTALLSELKDKLIDIDQINSVGSLYSKQGHLFKVDYDRNYKKGESKYFSALHSILSGIEAQEGVVFKSSNDDLAEIFGKNGLIKESYTLGLAQSDKNYVVVTDEPFMCFVCEVEKIPHISAIDLLLNQKFDPDKLLDYLEKLYRYNFLNYFSVNVYKELLRSILSEPQEKSDKLLDRFKKWLVPSDCTQEHKKLILGIFQKLGEEDSDSVYFKSISDIGRLYFSELFPDKYQELINKLNNVRMEVKVLSDEDDKIKFKVYFIEDKPQN